MGSNRHGFLPNANFRIRHRAQVTRKPTGHREADDAWGPSGPPRPRPARFGTSPLPRATAGESDRWSGTAPGYEFEGRRPPPGRGAGRPPPARSQAPQALPPGPSARRDTGPQEARRDTAPQQALRYQRPSDQPPPETKNGEPRRFRYTTTVSQPRPVAQPPL